MPLDREGSEQAARQQPIGVMDSGVGGLSVLQDISRLLPHENLLYVADSRHAPYGERSPAFVEGRVGAVIDFLVGQGAKAVVVACNTATEMGIEAVRRRHSIPIVGAEPAIKVAAGRTRRGVVGVLATRGTVAGHRVANLIEQQDGRGLQVLLEACPELVRAVEHGRIAEPETRLLLERVLQPMLDKGADAIVLGCTHFHLLRPLVEEITGPAVAVCDSGPAIARQLERQLTRNDLVAARAEAGSARFWTSGDAASAAGTFSTLLGSKVKVTSLP
jgi:glutamate racemase